MLCQQVEEESEGVRRESRPHAKTTSAHSLHIISVSSSSFLISSRLRSRSTCHHFARGSNLLSLRHGQCSRFSFHPPRLISVRHRAILWTHSMRRSMEARPWRLRRSCLSTIVRIHLPLVLPPTSSFWRPVLVDEAFAAKHMPDLGHDVKEFKVFSWKLTNWKKLEKKILFEHFEY